MRKRTSSQPVLNDDQRESSTKDLDSQLPRREHKMPGNKGTLAEGKGDKDKGK